MEILVVILLAVIAFILWRIYRQKESDREDITNQKWEAEQEQEQREKFKDYPHLYGKLEGNWLQVFANAAERGIPLLKIQFMLMVQESVKIDYSEGSMKWDTLWDASKELLEHLEKYHEGSTVEHEIALTTYWQIAAEAIGELIEKNPNTRSLSSSAHTSPILGEKLETTPFTDIEKITAYFPKKGNHPVEEITFFAMDGSFPRKSEGSKIIDEKIRVLGL